MPRTWLALTCPLALGLAACAPTDGTTDRAASLPPVQHVFVIAMENHDAVEIYGNPDAPYLNSLFPRAARALAFQDTLPAGVPSEPHYVWMEAGTNVFTDHTFSTDLPPNWFGNSTSSRAHLSRQLEDAGLSWKSYQEGLNWFTGACPVNDWLFYAAKHDPFVFFQDVSGRKPSASNPYCKAHHAELGALAGDLARGDVADYVFITPNLCHDMHGAAFCPGTNNVRAGDDWLAGFLPSLLAYADANQGLVFIVWDEGEGTQTMPFLALGPAVRPGHASTVEVTHSSMLRTVEELFGLPILPTVQAAPDLSDLLQ